MQDGRMQIPNVHSVLNYVVAVVVRFAVRDPRLDATPCQKQAEASRVVNLAERSTRKGP